MTAAGDADALRRARDAAEAANAAKTRYLVAVSHEIRSPLNAIYGYAQLLERGGVVAAEEAGRVIRRSAEHVTNLVEGLLDISRIESGVLRVRRDVVRLPALVDHVVDMFRMQAAARNLTLDYVVEGRLPRFVRTDEKRLRQILINLLSNAVKYTREGGATLTVAYRSQTATIEVADTGTGIAPEDLERIFEPFERGGDDDVAGQPGIGLGLALTRALVQILGGDITVTSERGRGSRFRVRLLLPEPLAEPPGASSYRLVTGYRGDRRTLLVVDDDPAQIAVLRGLLAAVGFAVVTATSGEEALALAEGAPIDLALLDIQMPGTSGWALAARLRERRGAGIRIVMVSANAHELSAGGEDDRCHDAFLTKPVELDALLDAIGRELALDWTVGDDDPPPAPAAAPAAIDPALLADLRRHVGSGHVRAAETALAAIEAAAGPAAVAEMRRLLDAFDMRGLARLLDDAG